MTGVLTKRGNLEIEIDTHEETQGKNSNQQGKKRGSEQVIPS